MGLLVLAGCDGSEPESKPDPCSLGPISTGLGTVHESVGEALAAAGENGTVYLCSGVFENESINLDNGVSLVGAGMDETFVDLSYVSEGADDPYPAALNVSGTSKVTIRDVSFTRGRNDVGGAMRAMASEILMERVRIERSSAVFGGAGIVGDPYLGHVQMTVRSSAFTSNSAEEGGAFAITDTATLVIEDTEFNGNRPNDIAFYSELPNLKEPPEPVSTYDFDGTVSVTCEWETATCE